jgi:hypothetical protein
MYQATAGMDAFASAVATLLSISTWKLVTESFEPRDSSDDGNNVDAKELVGERTYLEYIAGQAVTGFSTSGLINPRFSIRRSIEAPGDTKFALTSDPKRRIDVVATYSCGVNYGTFTDLNAVWTGYIRPFMLSQAQAAFGGSSAVALVAEEPGLDWTEHRIDASITLRVSGGGDLVECEITETTDTDYGIEPVPLRFNDPNVKSIHGGPMRITVTTETRTVRMTAAGNSGGGMPNFAPASLVADQISDDFDWIGAGGSLWDWARGGSGGSMGSSTSSTEKIRLSRTVRSRPYTEGVTGYQVSFVETIETTVDLLYVPYEGGGAP